MYKSSRTAVSTTNRRYSQPIVTKTSTSSSSVSPSRRGSEMVGGVKGGRGGGGGGDYDLPPPLAAPSSSASSSSSSQFDDKLMVVEAKGPRKIRGKDGDAPSFDVGDYNPDGSLRTIHRLPDFSKSYAEARKARYIRFTPDNIPESEKEVAIPEIFKKDEPNPCHK